MARIATIIKGACPGLFDREMENAVEAAFLEHAAEPLSFAALEAWKAGTPLGNMGFAYSRNPNGCQASPDFLVVTDGPAGKAVVTELELKSSRAGRAPTWNSGWPKCRRVYALNLPGASAGRPVIVVCGAALVSAAEEAALEGLAGCDEFRRLTEWANAQLAGAPWTFYLRSMFIQKPIDHVYTSPGLDGMEAAADAQLGEIPLPAAKYLPASLEFYAARPAAARKKQGQFFTPRPLAARLRALVAPHVVAGPGLENTLEPSAGTGELVELSLSLGRDPARHSLYELDPGLAEGLRVRYPDARVAAEDFLLAHEGRRFGLIVANPPFVELRECAPAAAAAYRRTHAAYARGRANIYAMFVVRCAELLADKGVAAFVLPTSFRSALSAAPARARLDALCEVLALDPVGQFDAAVQQEVLLLVVRRRPAGLTDLPSARPFVALMASGPVFAVNPAELTSALPTVEALGCTVATGGVVWNQHKALMDPEPGPDSPFIVYSANVPAAGGRLTTAVTLTRKNSAQKAQHLKPGAALGRPIEPPFVAVTRVVGGAGISSFRAVLVTVDDPAIAGRRVYCENHINTIKHPSLDILERVVASLRCPRTRQYLSELAGSVTMALGQLRSVPVSLVDALPAGTAAAPITDEELNALLVDLEL